MATCPSCKAQIRPVVDPAATPRGAGRGIAAVTWVCPECDVILGVSEVDLLSSSGHRRTDMDDAR